MSEKDQVVSRTVMPFSPGALVSGKYRIERALGQGGMGCVVLAKHEQLNQQVALKFMHAWLANRSPNGAARFLDEARTAARIRSDHVARVSDTGTLDDGSPYMVMEYLEGEDLEALLEERRCLPVSLAIDYALQVSEGLGDAHAVGIVHRDLKPSNLFVARQSDGSVRVKLLDFGISKMRAGQLSPVDIGIASSQPCGSPLYMAPEQMRSSNIVDERVDIWSLGVILYEMLAATPPFLGNTVPEICARVLNEPPEPLRTLRSDLPDAVEAAVMQCLEKDPCRRFQSVAAFARVLAPFGGPNSQAAATRLERMAQERERRTVQTSDASEPPTVPLRTLLARPVLRRVGALILIAIAGALVVGIGLFIARNSAVRKAKDRTVPSATAAPSAMPSSNPTSGPIQSETALGTMTVPSASTSDRLRLLPSFANAAAEKKPTATPARTATTSAASVGTSKAEATGTNNAEPIGTSGFGGRE